MSEKHVGKAKQLNGFTHMKHPYWLPRTARIQLIRHPTSTGAVVDDGMKLV